MIRTPQSGRQTGVSIVEVLLALTLFSTAVVGLYMASQSTSLSVGNTLKRDVEASYAELLLTEINVDDLDLETSATVNKTTKTSLTLSNGQVVYYTRTITSAAATPDLKEINVYFFRNSTDTTPYRKFRREKRQNLNYNLQASTDSLTYYRDASGVGWVKMADTDNANLATGSYSGGLDNATMGAAPANWDITTVEAATITGANDSGSNEGYIWRHGHEGKVGTGNQLIYKIPASQDQNYLLELGFIEEDATATAGVREMTVLINGVAQTNVDPYVEAGGLFKALVKKYSVSPAADTGGVYTVTIKLGKVGTKQPRLAWIRLK
ncbi:MAG: hypothetical protein AB7P76_08660 [Candidatus Melainabacteria bacterium]